LLWLPRAPTTTAQLGVKPHSLGLPGAPMSGFPEPHERLPGDPGPKSGSPPRRGRRTSDGEPDSAAWRK
jgi:hypothetical protein